jgi:hypothetical protein
MQLGCRAMKNRKFIENKGEFENLIHSKRIENCAIRDAMAQLKMKWRSFGDTFFNGDMHFTSGAVEINCAGQPIWPGTKSFSN